MTNLLRLLGNPVLETAHGEPVTGRATQRHRIALLALLASGSAAWSRDKLVALLWPDSTAERARDSLNESLYVLRRALGDDALVCTRDDVRLTGIGLRVDVRELQAALERGDPSAAVDWYRGPFLDGFFVSRAPEFEQWAALERDRLDRLYANALERLAAAQARSDPRAAAEWWRRLAVHRPYDSRTATSLMEALAAAGDPAAAVEHARVHGAMLRAEFGIEPPREVTALEERIRGGDLSWSENGSLHGASTERPATDADVATQEELVAAEHPSRDHAVTSSPSLPSATRAPRSRLVVLVGAVGLTLIAAMLGQLWRQKLANSPAEPVTLAVLPFHVLSAKPDDDFLGIGIPDVVITRLTGTRRLRVVPTSAILPFEHAAIDAKTAGRTLHVSYVLTGTIQRTDSAVQVRTQLLGAADGLPVWAREYRLALPDMLTLQDSIAGQIAAALPTEPSGEVAAPHVPSLRTDPTTYELFLRGRAKLVRHREQDTREAITAFEGAIARDSTFALGHAGLAVASAEMNHRYSSNGGAPMWAERAVSEAARAFALDSALPEVHEALAAVHRKTEFDWDGTITESRNALRLDPTAPMPYFYMGGAFYHLGLLEEGERVVREGLAVQPVGDRAEALRTLGTIALAGGRYAEAVALLQDVRRLSDRPVSDPHLAVASYYAGDTATSERVLVELLASPSAPAATRARAFLAGILAHRGERARALALLDEAKRGTIDHHVAYSIGVAHAQLGDAREAVRWLRAAEDTGFRCYPWFVRDPLLAPLRREPEFVALLTALKSGWEHDRIRYR